MNTGGKMSKKVVILCGGKGTRLRPYTYTIPKPMLPLGRKPILEYVINHLKSHGFTDLLLTVGYLKERIMEYFGDGSRFGVKLTYYTEEESANTAGSIIPTKNEISETFMVVMGDHLSRVNLSDVWDYHKEKGGIATIALKRMGMPLEYGIAELNEKGRIMGFREKPIIENLVNAGVYIFEPRIFDYIKEKDDFAQNVFPRLLENNESIYGFVFDEYWVDIGRVQDYENINRIISIIDTMLSATDLNEYVD